MTGLHPYPTAPGSAQGTLEARAEPLFVSDLLDTPAPPPPPGPVLPAPGTALDEELVLPAAFATRPPAPGHPDRRMWLLDVLRADSAVTRTADCRRTPIGEGRHSEASAEPQYRRKEGEDGEVIVYASGLQTCGRITCPQCGARIRHAERERMHHLNAAHLAAGGRLLTSIFSLSHGPLDDPKETLDALYAARKRAIGGDAGGAWAKDRKRFGIVGVTWHLDPPPIGRNGMHWHLHLTWFLDRELTEAERAELQASVFGRYNRALEKLGRRSYSKFNEIQRVRCAEKAASYVSKSDGAHSPTPIPDPASLAVEVARGDVKRSKGRLPLDVLAEWGETGDYAALKTFQAYERALDGVTWRYKPAALTRLYGTGEQLADQEEGSPEEQAAAVLDDAADAADDVNGAVVLRPGLDGWRAIRRKRGADRWIRTLLRAKRDDEARAYVGRLIASDASDRAPP